MNNFILRYISKVVVFFAPVFLVIILLEITARNMEDSFSFKHKFLIEKGTSINTLILGNSHAYYGIEPSILNDSAFSMAMPSQDLLTDFKILESFSTSLPNLNTVIFNLSVSSLFLSVENEARWRKAYYHFKMHLPDALSSSESFFISKSFVLPKRSWIFFNLFCSSCFVLFIIIDVTTFYIENMSISTKVHIVYAPLLIIHFSSSLPTFVLVFSLLPL